MEDDALIFEFSQVDVNDKPIMLSTSLIHEIFEYIDADYKLLINREGSSDEQRSKKLSIELIMRSGLEDYFRDVLLCDRWRGKLCDEAARRGHVNTLQWAREHGCDWNSRTCSEAARAGHWDIVVWAVQNGVPMEHDDFDDIDIDGFNLCEFAAEQDRWDIVQLALNSGCRCSEDIQLELLARL